MWNIFHKTITNYCRNPGLAHYTCYSSCMKNVSQWGQHHHLSSQTWFPSVQSNMVVIKVLIPFRQATVELSEEKLVSGTKVIPLIKIMHYTVKCGHGNVEKWCKQLVENLHQGERSVLTLSTVLDPRFKILSFLPNPSPKSGQVKKVLAALIIGWCWHVIFIFYLLIFKRWQHVAWQ